MTVLVAVLALDAAPVARLVALPALVADRITVAATCDKLLSTLRNVVARLKTVETSTSATTTSTATSARLRRLSALRLVMAV
jgi:hypothetical protein